MLMIHATPRVHERARQIAAAAGNQPVLSYVTAAKDFAEQADVRAAVEHASLHQHKCNSCSTQMVTASVIEEPHCVTCGSPDTKMVRAHASVPSTIKSDDDMVAVKCSCKATTLVNASVMKASKSIHCVACASQLSVRAEAEDDEGEDEKDDEGEKEEAGVGVELTPPGSTPPAPSKLAGGQPGTPLTMKTNDNTPDLKDGRGKVVQADADEETLTEDDMEELEGLDDDVEAAWDDSELEPNRTFSEEPAVSFDGGSDSIVAEEDPLDMGLGFDEEGEGLLALAELEDPMAEDGVDTFEGAAEDDTDFLEDEEASVLDLPEVDEGDALMDTVGLDDTVAACYSVQAGNKLILMKGHYAVATLTKERAGKNADVMGNDSFTTAVLEHARAQGLRKAIAAFKFAPVKVKVISAKTAERQVAAARANEKSTYEKALRVQAECMAMAAAGLARGRWKGVQNPLATAMEREFASLGVRRPAMVVASLLSKFGMEYAETLTTQAAKLATLTTASRKELADMLDMVEDSPVQDLAPVADGDFLMDDAIMADAHNDEMPGDDYSCTDTASQVTARFAQPAVSRQNRQVAAVFQPGQRVTAASASAQVEANAILSGRKGLGFSDL